MDILNINNILYLISNLFGVYVILRFMNVFFDRNNTNKRVEIESLSIYFIINSLVHIFFESPLMNLSSNLLLFFALTFIYPGKLSTRLISTALIYSENMCLKGIVYNFMKEVNTIHEIAIIADIISNLVLYLFVLVFDKVINHKNKYDANVLQWVAVFSIPVGSIIIASTLLLSNYRTIPSLLSLTCLLGINVMIFYLYDMLIKFYEEKYEKELLRQQSNSYINQFEIIKQSQDNIAMMRHDMKNHIFKFQDIMQKGGKQDILDYLESTLEFIDVSNQYVNSQNLDVDSILNYKIHEAKKAGAVVDIVVNIPNKLRIDSFDLNVILGNLMDNAIYAIKNSKSKEIKIEIEFDRNILYIIITNTYSGRILSRNGKLQSTKKDKDNHGIGLRSVETVVRKYDGIMDIDYDDSNFTVSILLYNFI
ncbi:sensor histidine kinase [Clostridium peptidivorans]|uniref:sensor histidine kinase n=1 Tax=Clostridium peptidivorans TaxID=100174 RepID=UPI000BE2C611|nr:GHKL domain-containing protein [Clostridium peptidivorans]